MAAAVSTTGLVPEVMHWFMLELERVDDGSDDAAPAAPAVAGEQ